MLKIAASMDRVLDPHNALTEHQKALEQQYLREVLIEAYRRSYPADPAKSDLLDVLLSELFSAKPGELMAIYIRHMRMFPTMTQNVRYRAALSRALATAGSPARTVIKKASFYSRYGELHHDGNVTRTEPQNQGEMRATPPQETSDAQPMFSPGKETLQKKRRGVSVSSHAHMKVEPDSAESPGGRPSLNVDEMNAPSREARNFDSF